MMKYTATKKIDSTTLIRVTATLDDSCNNGYDRFSVTLDTFSSKFRIAGEEKINHLNKNYYLQSCGLDEDLVLKHFPEIAPIIIVNGCDTFGLPSYPIMNTSHHLTTNLKTGMEYGRLLKKDALKLVHYKSESFAKWLIDNIEMFKVDADNAINTLTNLTQTKYKRLDTVSPLLYNDMHFLLVTESKGWNIYKGNAKNITSYPTKLK